MAIYKGKIRQRNSGGTYDYLLPETTIDMVNGLQDELDGKAIELDLEKVEDRVKELEDIAITAKSIGAKGDGVTDDYASLQELLNLQVDNVLITEGTYNISQPLVVSDNKKITLSPKAIIKSTVSMNATIIFDINSRGGSILGGVLDGNHLSNSVLWVKNGRYFNIDNLNVKNGITNGLLIGDPSSQNHSYEVNMNKVLYTHSKNNNVVSRVENGIHYVNASDSYISECLVIGSKNGVISRKGANLFNQVHCWNSYDNGFLENAFSCYDMMNTFVSCYADTPSSKGFAFYAGDNIMNSCIVLNSTTSPHTDNEAVAVYVDNNYRLSINGLVVRGNTSGARFKSVYGGSTLFITALGVLRDAPSIVDPLTFNNGFFGNIRVNNNESKQILINHNSQTNSDEHTLKIFDNKTNATNFVWYDSYYGVKLTSEDNKTALGMFDKRWSQVYAGTGAINTSDRNHKQQIMEINDVVLDAWSEVNYTQYKFNDAVNEKGDSARWHVGVIAQDIEDAFNRHGVSAFDYGILCLDYWDEYEENGEIIPSGSIYSIRPTECLMLESALLRRELNKLKGE